MAAFRTTIAIALFMTFLTGCSSSNNPSSPTTPGTPSAVGIPVDSAFLSVTADAQAGVGTNPQFDSQFESVDLQDETVLSGEVNAGANAAADDRSASGAASVRYTGEVTWESPGLLSSLQVEFTGGGESSTTGPSSVSTLAVGGSGGELNIDLIVPDGGVNIVVETGDDMGGRIRSATGGDFSESLTADDTATLFLPADTYRLHANVGGGTRCTDSPDSRSDAYRGSLKVGFRSSTP